MNLQDALDLHEARERHKGSSPVIHPSFSSLKATVERSKAPVHSLNRGFFISLKLQEIRDCFALIKNMGDGFSLCV